MPCAMPRFFKRMSLALVVVLVSCAEGTYAFEPAVRRGALLAGRPAAYYPVPPAAPRGDVRVASLGTTKVRLQGGLEVPVVQVRLVVANNSNSEWVVATRDQLAAIAGEPLRAAAFVNTDSDRAPLVAIPPGERRTLDLFFALPKGMTKPKDIPYFDVIWRLRTGQEEVAERTPFERFEIEPAAAPLVDYGFATGFGPYWWHDPFWPSFWFGPPVIVYPPRHAYPYRRYR
jgi:hypothetical protein